MFSLFFIPILYVLKLVVPAWIIFRIGKALYLRQTNNLVNIKREGLLFLLAVYAGSVIAVTIAPASISGFNDPDAVRLNMVPVLNTATYYINALHDHDDNALLHALENIIGNLILLIPLGILLPCIFRSARSFKSVLTTCLICSSSIELIQFFLRQIGTFRTVDIDDLILNTIGGMLGWLIYTKIIQRYFPVFTVK
jgi:glycopeptide antibiotics resistance protein